MFMEQKCQKLCASPSETAIPESQILGSQLLLPIPNPRTGGAASQSRDFGIKKLVKVKFYFFAC